MPVTQLALYNKALYLLGDRKLGSLTDEQERRHALDAIYDLNAVDVCLELAQPAFARKTEKLTGGASATTLTYEYDLPSDYISLVGLYSDSRLDQEVGSWTIEGEKIACDFDPVWLRYISNDRPLTAWSPAFVDLVAAYLAKEVATRIDGVEQNRLDEVFQKALEQNRQLAVTKEPVQRADATSFTLNSEWLKIYNDALLILGLEKIKDVNDDSQRRAQLDTALNTGLVENCLEDMAWLFGRTSDKLEYDPGVEPAWGYNRAIPKPANMLRLHGIFYDEHMSHPLKRYQDEGEYFFADVDEVYIQYVDADVVNDPTDWPAYFRKYVAAQMAIDAGPSMPGEPMLKNAQNEYLKRRKEAKSNDTIQSPPQVIHSGDWVSSRFRRGPNRGRP